MTIDPFLYKYRRLKKDQGAAIALERGPIRSNGATLATERASERAATFRQFGATSGRTAPGTRHDTTPDISQKCFPGCSRDWIFRRGGSSAGPRSAGGVSGHPPRDRRGSSEASGAGDSTREKT